MPFSPLPDLLCLGYGSRVPEFVSAPRRTVAVATVCGAVRMGAGAHLGASSVVRGDGNEVRVGEDFFLGERSTVHVQPGGLPTVIGAGVTIGGNCALVACTLGDRVVLEDNVVVLEGAQVGAGCALERKTLVPAGAQLQAGHLYRGNPAVAVRALEPGEIQTLRGRVRNTPGGDYLAGPASGATRPPAGLPGFVALTAQLEGRLHLAPDASIWFGARIDGGHHGIRVGSGSTIQDNCIAYAMSSPLEIGDGVTVGRNTSLQDCRIGHGSLIGMASFIAAGTVVEDDVVLAPGSVTLPRQVLRGGWVWGGRPARSLQPMTEEQRRAVVDTARLCGDQAHGLRRAIADFADNQP